MRGTCIKAPKGYTIFEGACSYKAYVVENLWSCYLCWKVGATEDGLHISSIRENSKHGNSLSKTSQFRYLSIQHLN
jgi:hypothetical protein